MNEQPATPAKRRLSVPSVTGAERGRVRLRTLSNLRWLAVAGQSAALFLIYFAFGYSLPLGYCAAAIGVSAVLNIVLALRYPPSHRLANREASYYLAFDVLQLAVLLYLTGGIENPFVFLLVAPVTVSAATQPPRNTIALGVLGAAATTFLVFFHRPLPWYPPGGFDLPTLYDLGALASVLAGMLFLALYAWRLAKESRQMADALAATEMVLAREQQLHALDGLAAAAAHELGTPLSTIAVVAKELARGAPQDGTFADDLALLQTQAERCREILRRLTRGTQQPDPLLTHVTVRELIEEASAPYRGASAKIVISAAPEANGEPARGAEPVGRRRPGVIYGLGNIISNAVDFALSKVEIGAAWSAREVVITITDDGPGISPLVLDALGEPYVTTRPARHAERTRDGQPHGMGLGFFIAKTLLERSGATVSLENRPAPAAGAIARVSWPRAAFEGPETAGYGPAERPAELAGAGRG